MGSDGQKIIMNFVGDISVGNTYKNMEVESRKGCVKKIFSCPVQLEPYYERFDATRTYGKGKYVKYAVPFNMENNYWFVCKLKIPLFDKVDWNRFDVLLSNLSGFNSVVGFEVFAFGNGVCFFLGCSSKQLLSVLRGVWQGVFPELVVLECEDPFIKLKSIKGNLCFFDLYPSPPYYRRMNGERVVSSLSSFVKIVSGLKSDEACFYQVLFVPVRNDWHFNVRSLVASESFLGARCPFGKTPVGMVKDLSRALFAVAVRFGCVSNNNNNVVNGLRNFCGSFLHSGKPFNFRSENDFVGVLGSRERALEMLRSRLTFCPGFVLDSSELVCFVNFPGKGVEGFGVRIEVAKGLKVPERLLQEGRPLGWNYSSGEGVLVNLPDSELNKGLWLLGTSRFGKSNSMIHQFLYHVEKGDACGFLDAHRLSAFELLGLIPERHAGRVVFLDFDDEEYVLNYNPFAFDEDDYKFFGRFAEDAVDSLQHLFEAEGFHRMAHLLSMNVHALLVLRKNLSAVPVLSSRTQSGDCLRREVVAKAKNALVKRFWREEFYSYPKEAFAPIANRISRLLLDSKTEMIFSMESNRVWIDRIMDEGKVLIAALPATIKVGNVVGGLMAGQFQKASFARTGKPSCLRNPFFLFVDEFHRFTSARIIDSIIHECIKSGLQLCVANQGTKQLSKELLQAAESMPSFMLFKVNESDAKKYCSRFDGKFSSDDIVSLDTGEVCARLGNDVVDFRCPPPRKDVNEKVRERIIRESRRKYYTPLAEVERQNISSKPKRRVFDSF